MTDDLSNIPELTSGTIILNKYEVVRMIGFGGMGEVYLARDILIDRLAAIKILAKELSESPEHKNRFLREARTISALNHPNILTVYEIGTLYNLPLIITEYVQGLTLRQLIESGPLSLDTFFDIAIQATQGLAVAHRAGIIHRDLKLDNFIFRQDGYLKILDFGIAKVSDARSLTILRSNAGFKTDVGIVLGTPSYMSPEQAKGEDLDPRSDIFSLGLVYYELLTGKLAFDGDSPMQIMLNVVGINPEPLPSTVPPQICAIIEKCSQKSPQARYQTMEEILKDLLAAKDALQSLLTRKSKATRAVSVKERTQELTLSNVPAFQQLIADFDQLIARQTEFEALLAEYKRAIAGNARPLLVVGESGSGKTQLLKKFNRWAEKEEITVVSNDFAGQESHTHPYRWLLPILAKLLLGLAQNNMISRPEKDIERHITTNIRIRYNIKLPQNVFTSYTETDEQTKWQVLEAVNQVFKDFAFGNVILLLLDNLHLANQASLEILGYLLRNPGTGYLLSVLTTAAEQFTVKGTPLREWVLSQSRYFALENLTLKPFTQAQVREFFDAAFQKIEISERDIQRIHTITGGNPYYVTEIAQLLLDTHQIRPQESWWRCNTLVNLVLPETIGNALLYKLEQHDEALRNLLAQAAVLGESFSFELLMALTNLPEKEQEEILNKAVRAMFIIEDKRSDTYKFVNSALQKILYETLSKRQTRRLHSKAAEAIKKLYGNKLPQYLSIIAQHHLAATEWQEAFDTGFQVLTRLAQQKAWDQVEKYALLIEEAYANMLENIEDYRLDITQPIIIKDTYANALVSLGKVTEALEQAQTALALAEKLANHKLIAQTKDTLCYIGWFQGKFPRIVALAEEGIKSAILAEDQVLERKLHFQAGRAKMRHAPFSETLLHFNKVIDMAEDCEDNSLLAQALTFAGIATHSQGYWREGLAQMERGISLTKQLGDRNFECRAYVVSSLALYYQHKHNSLRELHQKGIELARSLGWRIAEGQLHSCLGNDYLSSTNFNINLAKEFLQRGHAICQETGERVFRFMASRGLAKIALHTGNTDQAIEQLTALTRTLKQVGDSSELTSTLYFLGEAQETTGQFKAALATYEEATKLAKNIDLAARYWETLLGQARCLYQLEDTNAALDRLYQADKMISHLRQQVHGDKEAAYFIKATEPIYEMIQKLEG